MNNIGSIDEEGPVEPMYPHPDLVEDSHKNMVESQPNSFNYMGISTSTYHDMIKFLGENETDPKAIQLFKLYLTM